ncbi:hypothetical protein Poli38472_008947 [Pythium oligandrum]|uniref:Alcohol dehydrogenase-like N-terminal domain-containing protein n=1 Tax=Pythium oligandrum TaxID=41045 RepID=A0A8K1C4H9_PYTOL|nr:hypothetical protein Poli38472_008947 [Pythium oligandrum]|eukprot:TMW56299.1 hypothetical protein Poli38472_008947 [Pythium oligandrum]
MMQFMAKKEGTSELLPVAEGSCEPKLSHKDVMKALTFQGTSLMGSSRIAYGDHPKPLLTHEKDAIIKVELSAISGCDLNLYSGMLPSADKGTIPGHEAVGTVVEVGSDVHKFRKGDRVVVSLEIACGDCVYCDKGEFSECDRTNDSKLFGEMYGGQRGPAAIFGYSRLLGNVPGCQAEFVRVPIADVNMYHVPSSVPNDKAIFASDILASALHVVNLGGVHEGDIVAIWGLGPIGMFAGKWSKLRGAKRVIGIDCVPERLHLAREKFGIETIDRSGLSTQHVVDRLFDMLPLAKNSGGGVDVAIEAAGFRYAQTTKNKMEQTLGMETDTSDILNEMAMCTRKFGRLAIIGDYIGTANRFPMGHMMQKHLNLKSGFVPVQKYFSEVMDALEKGTIDPTIVITHHVSLQDAPAAYDKLYKAEGGHIKVVVQNTVP